MNRTDGKRGSSTGFTLLELLVVLLIIAVVAGGAVMLSENVDSHAQESLVQNEIREVRAAILRFEQDTGFLPKMGPFAWKFVGGHTNSSKDRTWFESPANFSQLFREPCDALGNPVLPWSVDRGRGWRGPYLRQDGEGYVDISDDLQLDGTGNPVGTGIPPLLRIPAVADPFDHPPVKVAEVWYLAWHLEPVHSAVGANQITDALDRHGRPYFLFDLNDRRNARLVSCGLNGKYESQGAGRRDDVIVSGGVVDTGDDIILYLFR